jgi:hypothetical protein
MGDRRPADTPASQRHITPIHLLVVCTTPFPPLLPKPMAPNRW